MNFVHYDYFLFRAMNDLAGQSKILDWLVIFFADYSQYLLGAAALIFLFYPKKDRTKNWEMMELALISAIIARFIIKPIIVLIWSRLRPFAVLSDAHQLVSVSTFDNWQSFPSGHALFFFGASTIIYAYNKELGIFFYGISFFMAISRVIAGVHWLSDIIFGAAIGMIIGIIVLDIFKKSKHDHF